MQLVELQCYSLLIEKNQCRWSAKISHLHTDLQKLFNLLSNCGRCLVAHMCANNNFKLTLINTLRAQKNCQSSKKKSSASGVILEWCTTGQSNLGVIQMQFRIQLLRVFFIYHLIFTVLYICIFKPLLPNLKYFSSLQFAHACDFHFLGSVHRLFLWFLWLSKMSKHRIHFTLPDSKIMYLL